MDGHSTSKSTNLDPADPADQKLMNREHSAGKGDAPRKVDGENYRGNFDAIFRKSPAFLEIVEGVCRNCGDCQCVDDQHGDSPGEN